MSKRTYRTRPSAVKNRDPKPEETPTLEVSDGPVIIRVAKAACTGCGCTTWQSGGSTRPQIATQEMGRYRQCAHCGKAHWLMTPMTDEEKKRYLNPRI